MRNIEQAYTTVIASATSSVVVGSVASLSAQLSGKLRAFGEGAVRVAVWVIGAIKLVVGAVGSVASLGCDLFQLILRQVGEVGWVGRCHFGRCCESSVEVVGGRVRLER